MSIDWTQAACSLPHNRHLDFTAPDSDKATVAACIDVCRNTCPLVDACYGERYLERGVIGGTSQATRLLRIKEGREHPDVQRQVHEILTKTAGEWHLPVVHGRGWKRKVFNRLLFRYYENPQRVVAKLKEGYRLRAMEARREYKARWDRENRADRKDLRSEGERRPTGRHTGGEFKSHLTAVQVKEIKALIHKGGVSQQKIGEMFAVSRGCVGDIARGLTWKDVPWPNQPT